LTVWVPWLHASLSVFTNRMSCNLLGFDIVRGRCHSHSLEVHGFFILTTVNNDACNHGTQTVKPYTDVYQAGQCYDPMELWQSNPIQMFIKLGSAMIHGTPSVKPYTDVPTWLQTPDNPALQLQLANCTEPVSLVKTMCNVYRYITMD
jgi:hypothetical protein